MAYKIRKSLQKKIDQAFAAAMEKEGQPVTVTRFSQKLDKKDIAFRSANGILLKDGRYLTRIWDAENNRYPWMAVDNLSVKDLKLLFDMDHEHALAERKKEENSDYRYQNFLKREETEDSRLVNPMDEYAYQNNLGNPEDIIIRKLCPEAPVKPNPEGVIGMAGSHYDTATIKRLRIIAREILESLPEEDKAFLKLLFSDKELTQKEIAELMGVTPAAVSKRKKKLFANIAADYLSRGYEAPDDRQKKKESKQRKEYEDHFAAVTKQLKKLFFPDDVDEELLAEEPA